MDCREFRETYTDLLDGQLDEADEVRFHGHLAECPRCDRFDRAYRLGVAALKGLPCPRASRTLTTRVLHTARDDSGGPIPSLSAGFAGAALVFALLGFLAADVGVLGRRESAAPADFPGPVLAETPADTGNDPAPIRLRDPVEGPAFWDPGASVQVRDADFPPQVRFAVPVVWAGR
jgi:anti-sigma factor RsiW